MLEFLNNRSLLDTFRSPLYKRRNELQNMYDDLMHQLDDVDNDKIVEIRDLIFSIDEVEISDTPYYFYDFNKFMNKKLTNIKLFNVLPLSTSLIPSYITFTTTSLLSMFLPKDMEKNTTENKIKERILLKIYDNISKYYSINKDKLRDYTNNNKLGISYFVNGSITTKQETEIKKIITNKSCLLIQEYTDIVDKETIWNKVFNLDSRVFKNKNKKFAFEIKTDGVACSILFHKIVPKDKNIISMKQYYETIKNSNVFKINGLYDVYQKIYENKEKDEKYYALLRVLKKNTLLEISREEKNDYVDNLVRDQNINDNDYIEHLNEENKKCFVKMKKDVTKFLNTIIKYGPINNIAQNTNIVKKISKRKTKDVKLSKMEDLDRYIEDQDVEKILKDKNYVVIDPNKTNLMYCYLHRKDDGIEEKEIFFSNPQSSKDFNEGFEKYYLIGNEVKENVKDRILIYSQNERKKENGENDVRNQILKMRKSKLYSILLNDPINGEFIEKTVEEVEGFLNKYSSMTSFYDGFAEYLKIKNMVNALLRKFYENKIFRFQKWHIYIRTQISESKFLNKFMDYLTLSVALL